MRNHKLEKIFRELIDKFPEDYGISEDFIDELFQGMDLLNVDKDNIEKDMELEDAINLYIGEWTLRSVGTLSKSPSTLQYIFIGFFVQVSNTLSCILSLVKDGFDYQASILVRNLIDISYTLLTLIIDEESRGKFLDAARKSDERTVWHKYFRFERMEKIIWKYISSLGDESEVLFLKNMGSEIYHWLSSFVHNDFISIFLYSYSEFEDENDEITINLRGSRVTRVSKILWQVIDIMFLVDMLFIKLLYDDKISISREAFYTETDTKKYWNQSIALSFIVKEYVLLLERNKNNE
jgi:hypothetical protein